MGEVQVVQKFPKVQVVTNPIPNRIETGWAPTPSWHSVKILTGSNRNSAKIENLGKIDSDKRKLGRNKLGQTTTQRIQDRV